MNEQTLKEYRDVQTPSEFFVEDWTGKTTRNYIQTHKVAVERNGIAASGREGHRPFRVVCILTNILNAYIAMRVAELSSEKAKVVAAAKAAVRPVKKP